MNQAQSYYSVIMRYRFNIYQMRILLKIVQRARIATKGKGKYSDFIEKAYTADNINYNFAIPYEELTGGKTHNLKPVKEALKDIENNWHVEHWDRKKGIWCYTSLIYNCRIDEHNGMVMFSAASWLIDYILDFRNGGYREYDFEVAMSLRNPFSARLYMLMCSTTKEMKWKIDNIKDFLGLAGRYKRASDFIRRVLEPAKRELDHENVNSFNYEVTKSYDSKAQSYVTYVTLYPIKRSSLSKNLQKQVDEYKQVVPPLLTNYLAQSFQFSWKELKANQDTLAAFVKLPAWQTILQNIALRAKRKRTGHGYIIAAMKSEIKAAAACSANMPQSKIKEDK